MRWFWSRRLSKPRVAAEPAVVQEETRAAEQGVSRATGDLTPINPGKLNDEQLRGAIAARRDEIALLEAELREVSRKLSHPLLSHLSTSELLARSRRMRAENELLLVEKERVALREELNEKLHATPSTSPAPPSIPRTADVLTYVPMGSAPDQPGLPFTVCSVWSAPNGVVYIWGKLPCGWESSPHSSRGEYPGEVNGHVAACRMCQAELARLLAIRRGSASAQTP